MRLAGRMKRLELLDYGRFVAAIAVLLFHYLYYGPNTDHIVSYQVSHTVSEIFQYGYLGVPFFFLISGYVIFFSALNRKPGEFLAARAMRLYPAYWVCLAITSACLMLWGQPAEIYKSQLLAHLTMLPRDFGHPYIDGSYWTLYWEWYFYFLVFLMLLVGLQKRLVLCFQLWPLAILSLWATNWFGGWEITLPYLAELYSFFAAGALFAILKNRITLLSVVSLASCFFICFCKYVFTDNLGQQSRVVIACVMVLIFAFFLFLNTNRGSNLKLPGSRLAGGLTYPVYLIHQVVGYFLLNRFATQETMVLWIFLVTLGAFLAAYLIHELVERRLSWMWKEVFNTLIAWPIDKALATLGHGHRLTLAKARGLLRSPPPSA